MFSASSPAEGTAAPGASSCEGPWDHLGTAFEAKLLVAVLQPATHEASAAAARRCRRHIWGIEVGCVEVVLWCVLNSS